jgi:diamine N-acetyltransferase
MATACFTRATLAHLPALWPSMEAFYAHEHLNFNPGVQDAAIALVQQPHHGAIYLIAENSLGDVPEGLPDSSPEENGLLTPPWGYFVLVFSFSLEFQGRTALLDELYLPPDRRGQGWGTQALGFAAQVCRQEGIPVLRLEVHRRNPKAQALYRRLGFVDHDRDFLTQYLQG